MDEEKSIPGCVTPVGGCALVIFIAFLIHIAWNLLDRM
jgi:hypothetical protein